MFRVLILPKLLELCFPNKQTIIYKLLENAVDNKTPFKLFTVETCDIYYGGTEALYTIFRRRWHKGGAVDSHCAIVEVKAQRMEAARKSVCVPVDIGLVKPDCFLHVSYNSALVLVREHGY